MNIYEKIYAIIMDKLDKHCSVLSEREKSEIVHKIITEVVSELPNVIAEYFDAFYKMEP